MFARVRAVVVVVLLCGFFAALQAIPLLSRTFVSTLTPIKVTGGHCSAGENEPYIVFFGTGPTAVDTTPTNR